MKIKNNYKDFEKEVFQKIGKKGGKSNSEKKQRASRENGKKGGRPRK